jgi:EAL domain-containing protein (putative c-di-GMP-specific phosphodiesterase class I)
MGVQLALDDFGTGYSSLSHLKLFPIGILKIDQSFVRDLPTDADDASIVSGLISMGKSLRMRVVAEGVETREQLAFLREQSCPEGQGHYFGKAMDAEGFTQLLGRSAVEPCSPGGRTARRSRRERVTPNSSHRSPQSSNQAHSPRLIR